MINDVLDLSKIEAGRMELSLSEFSIGTLLSEVANAVTPIAHANGKMNNACKFTRAGEVWVGASPEVVSDVRWIRLDIRDTGIGMSPEQLARLFQRCSRIRHASDRRYGGTGLGLALGQRLCTLMGGFVTV